MLRKQLSWYVSYRVAHGNRMEIAKNRDTAIKTACAMLDRGMDIQEVGPMIEPPQGKLIGPAELREIHKRRLTALHREMPTNLRVPITSDTGCELS